MTVACSQQMTGPSDNGDASSQPIASSYLPNESSPLLATTNKADQEYSKEDVPFKNIDGNRFWPVLASIFLSYIVVNFDLTLMASSHPVITSYFNSSNAAAWLTTVFYLAETVSQPIYGRVSDTIGRRPVLLFSMVIFAATTVWCGSAQTIGSFIAARAVCGLGAGGVFAVSNILMADIIKIEYRGIYQSYLNIAYGFGNGLGATLGGVLCDQLGWRAAFYLQLPFIFILLVVTYWAVPTGLGPNLAASGGTTTLEAFKSFDTLGAITLTATISGLILGINLGGNVFPWSHPVVIASLAIFAVCACLLVFVERRASRPVLPLALLATLPMGSLMWGNFFAFVAFNTILFNLPLLLQTVWGASPTVSGFYMAELVLTGCIASVFGGFFIKRTHKLKPMMTIGVILLLLGSVTVSCLTLPGLPAWIIVILDPYSSTAQGFLAPATTVAVLALSSAEDQAVVSTTLSLVRNLGSILGVAISSWIFQNALLVYLEREITGDAPIKRQIIDAVRRSVRAIAGLEEPHKAEVLRAYAQSLRLTFLSAAICAIIVIILIVPLRLPRIQTSSNTNESADEHHDPA